MNCTFEAHLTFHFLFFSGFFDHYIIPLANKLKECGVFGVSSDEYLTYAKQNREEWAAKGPALVEELKEQMQKATNKLEV
jgi:hypothetical protein